MRASGLEAREMDVGDLGWPLRRAARLSPHGLAISDPRGSLSYAQLEADVQALSAGLDFHGIPHGGRVGFLGANSLAHLACCMGVPMAGRVLVDLNFRLSRPELEFIVADCGLELLISDEDQIDVARALREAGPALQTLVYDGASPCPGDCLDYSELLEHESGRQGADCAPNSVAAISYTGGTTGRPKGVMLTHENFLANARHNLMATGHSADDHWLHVCPMFHVAGTANIFACTWIGSRQFVLPRFTARAVIDTIRLQSITHMVLVPTMLGLLLDELEREGSDEGLPSLRHLQYAASPIAPALQRRVLDTLSCEVVQFYGMTEAAPTVSSLSAAAHRAGHRGEHPWTERLGSIGAPVVGVEAEVRGPAGEVLPVGEIGELWVRGPNVMLGYWAQPEATEAAILGGWYRTGDAARMDTDGYLYLVDRLKDMIITGGENVYSIEVEAVLSQHPAVREVAVFGIPSARWGESVHAVVTLRPETTVSGEELVAHCRAALAGYKVPRTIDLTTEPLPKSGAGKILKKALREPYWTGHARRMS